MTVRGVIATACNYLYVRPALTFVVMGAAFLCFGVTSVNLFITIMANVQLFIDYGAMVIDDGALQQLIELLLLAAASGLCYVIFSVCDRTLLRRLTENALRDARV